MQRSISKNAFVLLMVLAVAVLVLREFYRPYSSDEMQKYRFRHALTSQTIAGGYLPFVPICRDADGAYRAVAGELEPDFRQALLAAGKSDDLADSLQPGFDGVSVLIPYKRWHSKETGAAVDAPDMDARYDLTMRAQEIIAETYLAFEVWFTVAAMYLMVTVILSTTVNLMEARLRVET